MSQRRLEAAIEAGKHIEKDDPRTNRFEEFTGSMAVDYDDGKDGVYCVQYSTDGDYIAVGYGDGSIEVLTTSNGMLYRAIKSRYMGTLPITGIHFIPAQPHHFISVSSDGGIYSCLISGGEACEKIAAEADNEINCFDFLLDGTKFVTSGKDAAMRIYDTNTAKCIQIYSNFSYNKPDSLQCGHVQRVFAIKSHQEQKELFISGGWDNMLKIWDVRTTEGVVRTISGPHLCGDSLDIQGTEILTGSWVQSDALQVWDLGSGELVQTLTIQPSMRSPQPGPDSGQGEFLYCARFAPNDVVIAGGSGTNSVHAIDRYHQKNLGDVRLFGAVQALDIHRRSVCVAGIGTRLRLASLS